jgi:hypothetical protein
MRRATLGWLGQLGDGNINDMNYNATEATAPMHAKLLADQRHNQRYDAGDTL